MEDLHQTSIRFVLDSEPNPTTCSKTCVVNSGFFKKRRLPFASSSKCNSTCFKSCLNSVSATTDLASETLATWPRETQRYWFWWGDYHVGCGNQRETRYWWPSNRWLGCPILLRLSVSWSTWPRTGSSKTQTGQSFRQLRLQTGWYFGWASCSTIGCISREGMLRSTGMGEGIHNSPQSSPWIKVLDFILKGLSGLLFASWVFAHSVAPWNHWF